MLVLGLIGVPGAAGTVLATDDHDGYPKPSHTTTIYKTVTSTVPTTIYRTVTSTVTATIYRTVTSTVTATKTVTTTTTKTKFVDCKNKKYDENESSETYGDDNCPKHRDAGEE